MDIVDLVMESDSMPSAWTGREPVTGRAVYVRYRYGRLTVRAAPPGAPAEEAYRSGETLLDELLGGAFDGRIAWEDVAPLIAALPVPVASARETLRVRERCSVRVEPPGGVFVSEDAAVAFIEIEFEGGGPDLAYVERTADGERVAVLGRGWEITADGIEAMLETAAVYGGTGDGWAERTAQAVIEGLEGCSRCAGAVAGDEAAHG